MAPTRSPRSADDPGRVIGSVGEVELEALRVTRAAARANASQAGVSPEELRIDLDATLLTVHSEKKQAAGNYKGGFGFHPLMACLSEIR